MVDRGLGVKPYYRDAPKQHSFYWQHPQLYHSISVEKGYSDIKWWLTTQSMMKAVRGAMVAAFELSNLDGSELEASGALAHKYYTLAG